MATKRYSKSVITKEMRRHISTLENLGLNSKQAQVYLALVEIGEGTVQEISLAANVRRTTVYTLLGELEKLGFVLRSKLYRRTCYLPEKPETVLERQREKVERFAKDVKEFSTHVRSGDKPRTLFFEGTDGFKKVWDIIFKSGVKEYRIITDPRSLTSFVSSKYIVKKIIADRQRLGIKSKQLIASTPVTKEIIAKDQSENRVSKILPSNYPLPFTTVIFGKSVAFISPNIQSMLLVIENEDFAATQYSLFETLWSLL